MPALPRTEITQALLSALNDGDISAALLDSSNRNPRKLLVSKGEDSYVVHAYAWTLTPGDRSFLPNEYRVQMTSVSSPLPLNPDGPTVILGYEPSLQMFAGFDVKLHRQFTTGSPSVQVDIRTLHKAVTDGMALDLKDNAEIACGIRPDHLFEYILTAPQLHGYGVKSIGALQDAVRGTFVSSAKLAVLSEPRRRLVQEVTRWSRNANFRHLVLQAYENRCAVTGMQLRLVDAAHILPVGAPRSSDEITNGIALSPTYHRAFDQGLIFLSESFEIRLNRRKADQLTSLRLGAGLPGFLASLGRPIILPSNPAMRPSRDFVIRANKFRQIA